MHQQRNKKTILLFLILVLIAACKSKKGVIEESGNTYSTDLIQKMLSKGGNVNLPKGIFLVDKKLLIREKGTHFRGEGLDKTVIQFAPGIGIEILNSNIEVSDLHLTGTYKPDGNEQHTLNVRGPFTNVHIHDIKVSEGDDTGIRIGYAKRKGKRAVAYNCSVTNCIIEDIKEGSGIEVMSAEGILLKGNTIKRSYQNGIRIAGGKNCVLNKNTISEFNTQGVRYAYGIYVKGGKTNASHDYVDNVRIENNNISGMTKAMSIGTQTSNINIINNQISLYNVKTGIGITLENNLNGAEFGYRNINIRDNIIGGKLRSGIELHTRDNDPAVSGEFVYIEGNKITDYTSHGISIRGNNFGEVKNIYVNNNYLAEDQNSNTKEAIIISKCNDIYLNSNDIAVTNKKKKVFLRKGSIVKRFHDK